MSLKKITISGVKWTSASQVGKQIIQITTTIIIARIIAPSDFGLLGMAMVVIGFLLLIKDLGTGAAVIQKKNISEEALSSVYWVNIAIGLLVTFILFIAAPWIAQFFREPPLTPVLKVLSFTLLISGLGTVQQAVLERNLLFHKLAKLEITTILLGGVTGISLALLGYGVWSLVFQSLMVSFSTTFLLWFFCPWKPKFVFRWAEIQSIQNFSLNLVGFNIFNFFARNTDDILIGRYLGSQDLGYYNLAYRILLFPLKNISQVISRIMFPVFSKIQHDDSRFRYIYLKVSGAIALISFPIMFGLVALASPFVYLLFGPKWEPLVLLLIILAPVGMLQSIGSTVGTIYQVKGRTDWLFKWGLFSGTITIVGFIIGLQWGIVGVAISYAVTGVLLIYPNYHIPFKLINLPVIDLAKVLVRPLMCSLLMFALLLILRRLFFVEINSIWLLSSMVLAGILGYLGFSWWLNRKSLRETIEAF